MPNNRRVLGAGIQQAVLHYVGNGTAIKSGWISGSDGFLAVDKNGKALAGAAKTSFMKKCEADAKK